jgi:hypothetical protein
MENLVRDARYRRKMALRSWLIDRCLYGAVTTPHLTSDARIMRATLEEVKPHPPSRKVLISASTRYVGNEA